MQEKNFLGAYLLYYWPSTYVQIKKAISYSEEDFTAMAHHAAASKSPLCILDVGSGPAPATAALCDFFTRHGAVCNATLVDSSKKALGLAAQILSPHLGKTGLCTHIADLEKETLPSFSHKFDVIVMSHALNELWKGLPFEERIQKRMELLRLLSGMLEKDGAMLLCEPAMLCTSRDLIECRNRLCAEEELGLSVASPCTCHGQCPVLNEGENLTCHAEFMWQPPEPVCSIARRATLDRGHVKMVFFVLKKRPCGARKNDGVYRVVSAPMLNKSGRIRFLLCNGMERIPLSAKKGEPHASAQGFFDLQRYDSVRIENPELRGTREEPAFGVGPETKISRV